MSENKLFAFHFDYQEIISSKIICNKNESDPK